MKWLLDQLKALRCCCAGIPDLRTGEDVTCSMQNIAMAAFPDFRTQYRSILAHQRDIAENRARFNAHTHCRLTRIPCDITNANTGMGYFHTALVANLPVNRRNVAEIVDCGRAHWRLENNGCNAMKSVCGQRRNFGHGWKTLSRDLLTLDLVTLNFIPGERPH